jgi:hypothetical protein
MRAGRVAVHGEEIATTVSYQQGLFTSLEREQAGPHR